MPSNEASSDQEFDDEFIDPAVEEILSDEEMQDYPDSESEYDLAEYEEALTEQFGQPFSHEIFEIPSLKVIQTVTVSLFYE